MQSWHSDINMKRKYGSQSTRTAAAAKTTATITEKRVQIKRMESEWGATKKKQQHINGWDTRTIHEKSLALPPHTHANRRIAELSEHFEWFALYIWMVRDWRNDPAYMICICDRIHMGQCVCLVLVLSVSHSRLYILLISHIYLCILQTRFSRQKF